MHPDQRHPEGMEDYDSLVDRVRGGDLVAFDRLVEAVEPEVRACVAAHAVRTWQVDEIVQDAFVQAYRKLDQYQGGGSFAPWVKAIARNRLRMELRQTRRAPVILRFEAALIDDRLNALEDPDPVEGRVARLRTCLEGLDKPLRHLIEAHHIEGLGLDLLAERLARTPNWVAVRLYRVRRALATCMEAADVHG